MNKKLLTLAVGAALAAGAVVANADATMYGRMHVSIDQMNNKDPNASAATNGTTDKGMNFSSNSSRFGVKGSDDFGGGMKGIFQWETDISADEGKPDLQNRNSYAGIAGGFGTVILGRHDTPYKSSTGRLDPFSETIGDYNGIMGAASIDGTKNNTILDNRVSNALMYTTPDMSGLTGSLMLANGTGANDKNGGTANGFDNQDNKITSLGVSYSQGPIFATFAMEQHKEFQIDAGAAALNAAINAAWVAAGKPAGVPNSLSAGAKLTGNKLGVGYDMGMAAVGLVVENMKISDSVLGDMKQQNVFLSASMKLAGNSSVALSIGQAGKSEGAGGKADDAAQLLSLGYFQGMSKTSKAYVVYSKMDNKGVDSQYTLGNSGHGDIVNGINSLGQSYDVTGLSAGLIIDF